MKKAKAHLELNLAKVVKDNKKGFFKLINSKIISRENIGPLLNGKGTIATQIVERLRCCTPSFFNLHCQGQPPGISDPGDQGDGPDKRRFPLGWEELG